MIRQRSSIKTLRERLHDGIRRQHHQQKFKSLREQLIKSNQSVQYDQFNILISKIDQDNFANNRKLLRYYSYDQSNSYSMVSFSGLVYDFLIENPYDYDTIEITKAICRFQDVDIPITEQFVNTLVKLLFIEQQKFKGSINQNYNQQSQKKRFTEFFKDDYYINSALEIITLLLGYHKYEETLRQMLLYADFAEILMRFTIQQIERTKKVEAGSFPKVQLASQQVQNFSERISMVCEIYCLMIKSMPPVQQKFFAFFVSQLSQIIEYFPYLDHFIADSLAQINLCFAPNLHMCKYLMQCLQKFCLNNFHNFGKEMLALLKFCCRSKYFISQKCFRKLLETSKEHHDDKIKKEALFCLKMFLTPPKEEQQLDQQEYKQHQMFYQKVLDFLSQEWFYKPILRILANDPQMQGQCLDLFYALFKGFMKAQDLIQSKGREFYRQLLSDPYFFQIIDQCLISFQKTATDYGLNIVFDMLVLQEKVQIQSQQASFKLKAYSLLSKPLANIADNNLPLKENRNKEMEKLAQDIISIITPRDPKKMDIQC